MTMTAKSNSAPRTVTRTLEHTKQNSDETERQRARCKYTHINLGRSGMDQRPLVQKEVVRHLADFGLKVMGIMVGACVFVFVCV